MKKRRRRTSLKVRLWSRIDVRGPDECWPWTGAPNANGYGVVHIYGRGGWNEMAHRLVYRARVGPIPPGHGVLHRCDNPPCCNPAHLFTGTQAVNIADAVEKGRIAIGERHSQAKLTDEQVLWIRKSPLSTREAADLLGVHYNTVLVVRLGRTWTHLLPAPGTTPGI